jgi:hypothetical protein
VGGLRTGKHDIVPRRALPKDGPAPSVGGERASCPDIAGRGAPQIVIVSLRSVVALEVVLVLVKCQIRQVATELMSI